MQIGQKKVQNLTKRDILNLVMHMTPAMRTPPFLMREGGFGRGDGYAILYCFTDTYKSISYIIIAKAEYVNTQWIEEFCSYVIVFYSFFIFVLLPIQLDYKFAGRAIEVGNISSNWALAKEAYRILAQKIVP